ncbi:MAG: hypothetical protein Q9214_003240 [Letrouitia sp. 1 TL-2023]
MDPFTAAGLAATIVAFIDVGTKVATRVKELSDAGNIPEVFRDIRTRLPLIISIIGGARHATDNLSSEAESAFEEIVRQCFKQISQLDEILEKVIVSRADSRFRKVVKAGVSLVEEERVQRIAAALRDNVQLLTFLNVTPGEKGRPKADRRPSEAPPSYESATGAFLVPFSRDEQFVGRESSLRSIASSFETQNRVAISGMGGIGKSQVAIEYCYRHKESKPDSHIMWVYGGTIARFYQGYKKIAQQLDIPGWDDPEASILELVCSWLSNTTNPYLLVVDNADNIEHWWPGKYRSGGSLDDPSKNLSKFLPDATDNSRVLITTRDNRVAGRLIKEGKPIVLQPMSHGEAKLLFLSKLGGDESDFDEAEVHVLLEELDYLPLAMSQAAAFIEENGISIADYTNALQGEDASVAEEFLHEELDDRRRDEESVNSVFRTLRLSYDQIKQQKPRAADLLCLLAMLDRQSVPKFLLKVPEVTTSLSLLQSFNLVINRTGSQSFQLHRLVQRFVQLSIQSDNATQKWQDAALACVSRDYPTEIGVAEWSICDALAPHVHVIVDYKYTTTDSRLNLAHLLCWAADFDIERGMYTQALERAEKSLTIYRELVTEGDERLAAATWLYGRLRYYQARSTSDIDVAADLLQKALSISEYPSLNFAESAFELAHLYYDQRNGNKCLEMGKASFKCWEALEGPSSVRTLDNMHDYALELAMLGQEKDGIATWQEILDLCATTDASENTKTVFTYRSMAGIAEFEGDAALAEILYAKLIRLCEALYHSEHVHLYDYRLSHLEQIMLQGKLEEAMRLSEAILASCKNTFEWCIQVSCLQTIAACYRSMASYSEELTYRLRILELHNEHLGLSHKDTIDAENALADCFLNNSSHSEAKELYQRVLSWRNIELGLTHVDTVRAIECLGICHAHQGQNAAAEAAYLDALDRQSDADVRLLDNLQTSLWNQGKWEELELWSRRNCEVDETVYRSRAQWNLISALERQAKAKEAFETRTGFLALTAPNDDMVKGRRLPTNPPARHHRRFGRIVHPRTWSA